MTSLPEKIKFENNINPNSAFDIIKIEELFQRKTIDHNIEHLHRVEFFILLLITEGSGYHTVDFIDYKYKKGTLITIRKDQIHKFFKSKNTKGSLLMFTSEFLISYLEKMEAQKALQLFNELIGIPKIQLVNQEFEKLKDGIHRIEEEYYKKMDDYSLGIIRSELHILITRLFRIKSKRDFVITEKKYINEFIQFQKLVEANAAKTTRVLDYALMMPISSKTLNTITKSIINKTAKEFIDEINTKQIKRLLINTSLSIKEIAYASGFEESTNFYKYFKRQTKVTPEHFRASF